MQDHILIDTYETQKYLCKVQKYIGTSLLGLLRMSRTNQNKYKKHKWHNCADMHCIILQAK